MGIEPTSEAWALVTTNLVNSDRRFKWTVSELSLNSFQFGAFPGVTAQWWVLSKSNEINPFATTYSWMHLRARMLISIRNRQVVGSTPTLGSRFFHELRKSKTMLADTGASFRMDEPEGPQTAARGIEFGKTAAFLFDEVVLNPASAFGCFENVFPLCSTFPEQNGVAFRRLR